MSGRLIIISLIWIVTSVFSQSYNWPCQPFDQQHWINGTFCECRAGSAGNIDHFHDGVDIHLPQGNAVYSVINGTVTSIGTVNDYGINSWVRVGRYCYVHVDPNPALNVGENIFAYETVLGWTNSWNHIHFKDGYPGSEINAIRLDGGLTPLVDNDEPQTEWVKFYPDNSTNQFSNNRVFGAVDIVCKSTDRTDEGPIGDNNGIYKIGYEIFNSGGESVFGPHLPFEFYDIPVSDNYITNVYFPGSSTSTYLYIVSNNLYSNSSLNVTQWDLGEYTARIYVYDQYLNANTSDISFEVVETDTESPAPPRLLSILTDGNGFIINWLPNTEDDLEGYRLYFSYDMETWYSNHDESYITSDMTQFQAESFSNSTGYFKLTAVDNAPFPNESDPSNVFVFRRDQSNQGLLVINAYADQNGLSQHPFAGNVGLLADSHELGIETISDTLFTIEPSFEISNDYVPVILSGDRVKSWPNELIEILGNSTFWTVGPKALESISSSDAGYSFLNNTLGIAFTGTIPTPPEIVGLDHPFSNFSVDDILTDIGYDSLNVMDIPLENENTLAVLADTVGRILAMATLEPPTLMTGVPVEALPEESRIDYFDRSIQFLLGSTASIVYESNLIPYNPSISFYPNPFNSQGIIKINANPGTYHIYLFNISGATVWERKIQFSQSDRLSIRLPKFLSKRMSSGPYFILLKGQSAMFVSEKILYIK